MTSQEIASTILAKRHNTLTPIVRQQDMRSALGADGYQEAMRLGWLIPNYDTGEMQIPNDAKRLGELRAMAEAVSVGNPTSAVAGDPEVGDMATISQDGKIYMGAIKAVKPGGRYEVGFDPNKPKPVNIRDYAKNEIKVTKKGIVAPTNTTPAPQQTQKSVVSTPYVSATTVGVPYSGTPLVK